MRDHVPIAPCQAKDACLCGDPNTQTKKALEFWNSRRPSPQLAPSEVVGLLMAALQKNDQPEADDGLRTVSHLAPTGVFLSKGGVVLLA